MKNTVKITKVMSHIVKFNIKLIIFSLSHIAAVYKMAASEFLGWDQGSLEN
jgi:hypothetical protein